MTARRQLRLSPQARAEIKLPLRPKAHGVIDDANGQPFAVVETWNGTRAHDNEIAAFIAALVNEALAPTAHVNCHQRAKCEDDCPWRNGCDNALLIVIEPSSNTELRQVLS